MNRKELDERIKYLIVTGAEAKEWFKIKNKTPTQVIVEKIEKACAKHFLERIEGLPIRKDENDFDFIDITDIRKIFEDFK